MLHLDPCVPRAWRRFEITVENPRGVTRGIAEVEVDGTPLAPGSASLPLIGDGATHRVRVTLG